MITPKNWKEFQHYKDRSPSWIKLHRCLLDDYDFAALPVESRALAPMLWLLASEGENGEITSDPKKLAFRLRCSEGEVRKSLGPLLEAGFFIIIDEIPPSAEWPSRYVPDTLRAEIMARDENKCKNCASIENLEIDHIIPVSAGGESVRENLQVLCRSCNRSKRVRSAEQFATLKNSRRSLEKETQVKTEKNICDFEFEKFKKAYPKRKGAQGWPMAQKFFEKAECPKSDLICAASRYAETIPKENIGTPYVPMAESWMRKQSWREFLPTEQEKQKAEETERFLESRGFGLKEKTGGPTAQN